LIAGADALSKAVDRMDFGLRAVVLDYVLRERCPADLNLVVDRFAAAHNAVGERFNARFDTPEAEAVDAFTQFWGDDFNFILGDFNRTDAIMDHIERDDAEAVIIVPEHTSKPFWNRIWSAAWQRRVESWEFLGGEVLEAHAENAGDCFFGERFNCRVLLMVTRQTEGSLEHGGGGNYSGGRGRGRKAAHEARGLQDGGGWGAREHAEASSARGALRRLRRRATTGAPRRQSTSPPSHRQPADGSAHSGNSKRHRADERARKGR
jgi:hypothetical protein